MPLAMSALDAMRCIREDLESNGPICRRFDVWNAESNRIHVTAVLALVACDVVGVSRIPG
jgi:hypothetical protein